MMGHEINVYDLSLSLSLSLNVCVTVWATLSLSQLEPPWVGGGAILGSTPHPQYS